MPSNPRLNSDKEFYPFTKAGYQDYLDEQATGSPLLIRPPIFTKLEFASFRDIDSITQELLGEVFDSKLDQKEEATSIDGPTSREAVAERIYDALEQYHNAEKVSRLPKNNNDYPVESRKRIGAIPQQYFNESEARCLYYIVLGSYQKHTWKPCLEDFTHHLNRIKSHAMALELNGQFHDSLQQRQRVVALFRLKRALDNQPSIPLPKKLWPHIRKLEIIFGVRNYLDVGILPTRIHLQKERNMDKSNFSQMFKSLKIAELIPSNQVPQSKFLFKKSGRHGELLFYAWEPEATEYAQENPWPAYMNHFKKGKGSPTHKSIRQIASYRSQKHTNNFLDGLSSADFGIGDDEETIKHNIATLKARLGPTYWFLLMKFGMEDLKNQKEFAEFIDAVKKTGLNPERFSFL